MKNKKNLLYLKKNLSLVILIAILGVLFAGTLVVTRLSRQRQEIRQQASVDQGLVIVTPSVSSQPVVGQPASIDFSINTNSVQIDGVQLIFTINSQVGSNFDFSIDSGSGLTAVAKSVQDQGGGQYSVQVIAIGPLAQPYSTTNTITLGRLNFTPTTEGSITLNFDPTRSKATVYQSPSEEDQLRTIPNFSTQATLMATATPTPTPVVENTSTPTPTATPTSIPGATNTPTPTPTSAGSGGVTIKQCNESCSSNTECATNLTCYNNQCRLATNVSNSSCQNPADQGIRRSCNEYCSDSNECGSGLTCYFNRCRNANNVSNTTCQSASSTTSGTTGGTTKTTAKPTSTPKYTVKPSPTQIAQVSQTPSTVTNVFGTSPQPTSALPTFTPLSSPRANTPVPTQISQSEDGDSLSRLPQILLIAAIISLPILFFAPTLISRMAMSKPKVISPSGLEHSVVPRPVAPLPKTDSDLKGFAGITSPSADELKSEADKLMDKKKDA